MTKENIRIDHITPLSKGGRDIVQNLQPMCFACNNAKGDRVIPIEVLRDEHVFGLHVKGANYKRVPI